MSAGLMTGVPHLHQTLSDKSDGEAIFWPLRGDLGPSRPKRRPSGDLGEHLGKASLQLSGSSSTSAHFCFGWIFIDVEDIPGSHKLSKTV
jgi:hypothetical protein